VKSLKVATKSMVKDAKRVSKPVKRAVAKRKSTVSRNTRKQYYAMTAVALVALTLTGLSLTHLTEGIAQVTGGNTWESAAMAVGIDAGFVALEIAQVIKLGDETRKVVDHYAKPAIMGTMVASALLNAFGFTAHATGMMVVPAALLGFAIPVLIYAMTRVAVAMAK
jgi:hypothetical protein